MFCKIQKIVKLRISSRHSNEFCCHIDDRIVLPIKISWIIEMRIDSSQLAMDQISINNLDQ